MKRILPSLVCLAVSLFVRRRKRGARSDRGEAQISPIASTRARVSSVAPSI